MKKSKLFAVFATAIIGGSIVGVLICANPENDANTLDTQQYGQKSTEAYMHPDANYYEEGVDTEYNYITNLGYLKELDMPVVGLERISDETDYILKENGETGNAVTIVSSKKKGSHMQIISLTRINLLYTYQNELAKFLTAKAMRKFISILKV